MPAHGARATPDAHGAHACLLYDTESELRRCLRKFLADGRKRGEQLMCVGERAIDAAVAEPGLRGLVSTGALRLADAEDVYQDDVHAQLAYYAGATREALADGFSGLCVAADLSAAADRGIGRLVPWELRADAFMASGSGMSALCAYPTEGLSPSRLDDLVALHPVSFGGTASTPEFRLYSSDQRLLLVGAVDHFSADRLARLLEQCPVEAAAITVDLSGLEFMDSHAAFVLETWSRRVAQAGSVRLEGMPSIVRRLWEILGYGQWLPTSVKLVET